MEESFAPLYCVVSIIILTSSNLYHIYRKG